jgi:AraC-like DNA-binding protein
VGGLEPINPSLPQSISILPFPNLAATRHARVGDVACLLGVHHSQVYRLKLRGLVRLKRQISILEKGRIRAGHTESRLPSAATDAASARIPSFLLTGFTQTRGTLVSFLKNNFTFLKDSSGSACSRCVNAKVFRTFLLEIHDWPEKARQARFHASELARQCGVSRRDLERFFRDYMGQSPQRWLDDRRQRELEEWLKSDLPIKELSFNLGYKQASHLTRQFKEVHGMTPSEWRESHRAPKVSSDFPNIAETESPAAESGIGPVNPRPVANSFLPNFQALEDVLSYSQTLSLPDK